MTASFRILDVSAETNSFSLHTPVLNAGNIDQYTNPTGGTLLDFLVQGLNGIQRGTLTNISVSAYNQPQAGSAPTDPNAQNEIRLRFSYTDDVNQRLGSFEVPNADLDTLNVTGGDDVPLTGTEMTAFVNAVEGFAVSRDGNPITIVSCRIVGRNS